VEREVAKRDCGCSPRSISHHGARFSWLFFALASSGWITMDPMVSLEWEKFRRCSGRPQIRGDLGSFDDERPDRPSSADLGSASPEGFFAFWTIRVNCGFWQRFITKNDHRWVTIISLKKITENAGTTSTTSQTRAAIHARASSQHVFFFHAHPLRADPSEKTEVRRPKTPRVSMY